METPLSPLDFARRARRLYPDREAVVDGDRALHLPRVLRALRPLVGRAADNSASSRATAWPASRRTPTRISNPSMPCRKSARSSSRSTSGSPPTTLPTSSKHSGARVVCVHADYLDAVDSIRDQVPGVEHFVAFEGSEGRLDRLRGHTGRRHAGFRRRRRSTRPK